MPPVLAVLPLIAAITGIAGTGVGLGLELSNQPGTPKPVTPTPEQTAATANATKQAQLASISRQDPNVQAATGGSLAPDARVLLDTLLAGQAGAPGVSAAQNDLVRKLLTGNSGTVTAGNNTGGGVPGTPGGLTNSTFG